MWKTNLERLVSRVVKQENGCWFFTGYINPQGYGRLRYNGRKYLAHVLSYNLIVGPVPTGLCLDHLCRNRHCINPEHLEPVTQRTNILRGEGIAAKKSQQTTCIRGHDLTVETYRLRGVTKIRRACLTCRAMPKEQRV